MAYVTFPSKDQIIYSLTNHPQLKDPIWKTDNIIERVTQLFANKGKSIAALQTEVLTFMVDLNLNNQNVLDLCNKLVGALQTCAQSNEIPVPKKKNIA